MRRCSYSVARIRSVHLPLLGEGVGKFAGPADAGLEGEGQDLLGPALHDIAGDLARALVRLAGDLALASGRVLPEVRLVRPTYFGEICGGVRVKVVGDLREVPGRGLAAPPFEQEREVVGHRTPGRVRTAEGL